MMPPGRELDALVAEKVMGFTWRRAPFRDVALKALVAPEESPLWLELRGDEAIARYYRGAPKYSTSWDAMRLVVERLVALGFWLSINANVSGQYWCVVYPKHGAPIETDYGDTAPHAVALAALKAVEANHA